MKYFIYILFLFTTLVTAQKAQFNKKSFELDFKQPEFFKGLKTFSYEIQDDGEYWNHNYEEDKKKPENFNDFKTIQSLVEGPQIKGLTKVAANGDLQIVVGFIGSQLKNDKGALVLEGTMSLMMFVNNDELFFNEITNVKKTIASNLQSYPVTNRFERNKSKAKIVTGLVQKHIDELGFLFTGKSDIELSFGSFKKTKKGQAEAFNEKSLPIVAGLTSKSNVEELNKAKTFWKEQLDVDFGKKVKEKHKLKVIYANLASASVLAGDKEKAKEFSDLAIKNSGLFDSFSGGVKDFIKKKELESSFVSPEVSKINKEDNYIYYHKLKGKGLFNTGKKDREFDEFSLQRFVPKNTSNITSLDKGIRPEIKLYLNEKPVYVYSCTDKHKVKFENGDVITFKLIKGTYTPFIKRGENEEVILK